jgi:hypothetical protein
MAHTGCMRANHVHTSSLLIMIRQPSSASSMLLLPRRCASGRSYRAQNGIRWSERQLLGVAMIAIAPCRTCLQAYARAITCAKSKVVRGDARRRMSPRQSTSRAQRLRHSRKQHNSKSNHGDAIRNRCIMVVLLSADVPITTSRQARITRMASAHCPTSFA